MSSSAKLGGCSKTTRGSGGGIAEGGAYTRPVQTRPASQRGPLFGAVTQLVECHLCKVEVESSSLFRSIPAPCLAESRDDAIPLFFSPLLRVGESTGSPLSWWNAPPARALPRLDCSDNRCRYRCGSFPAQASDGPASSVPVAARCSRARVPTPGNLATAAAVSVSSSTV